MPICANHYANQKKVQKTMPTVVPSTFNKWQNSAEKSQAHNLKVVDSNPTPATNLLNKLMTYTILKNFVFWGFLFINKDFLFEVTFPLALVMM